MNSVEGYKGFITFAVLSGVVLTVLIGFNFISKEVDTRSQASEEKVTPLNINVTNITENSAQISWITQSPTPTFIVYSSNFNDCDNITSPNCLKESTSEDTTNHEVKLNNLLPLTKYYFKIRNPDASFHPSGPPLTFETKTVVISIPPKESSKKVGSSTPEKPSTSNQEPESEGIIPLPLEKGTENQKEETNIEPIEPAESYGILGKQTNIVSEMIIKEFQAAMENSDLNYDFNRDGNVTIQDYPLFMEFIQNPED